MTAVHSDACDSVSPFNASATTQETSGTGSAQYPTTYNARGMEQPVVSFVGMTAVHLLSEPPYQRRFRGQAVANRLAGDPLEPSSRPSSEPSASGQMVT